jgi:antitoxin component YwqK of YwqJK toxin-antitoxin module
MKIFLSVLAIAVVYAMAGIANESTPQSHAEIISDSSQIKPACIAPDIYPCDFPDNFTWSMRRYYGLTLNPLNTKWVETEPCHYSFEFSVNGQKYGKDRKDYSCSATAQENENIRIKWISKFGYTKEEGTFEIKRKIKNGVPDGISKIYDDNGNLLSIQTFKNGVRNGDEKTYSTKGVLTTVRSFSNNALDLTEIEYDEFGNKTSEVVYKKGLIECSSEYGSYKGKGSPDVLACTVFQSMGKVDPQQNCYELVNMINACRKKNESKPFLSSTATFKDGLKHGVELFYYEPCGDDGTQRPPHSVYKESPYEKGVLNGTVKEFYPNGKLKSSVTYEDGDAVSEKNCYSMNGKVQKTGTEKMECD